MGKFGGRAVTGIDECLKFVAGRVKEAEEKEDYPEVVRILSLCAETLLDKVNEISKKLEAK